MRNRVTKVKISENDSQSLSSSESNTAAGEIEVQHASQKEGKIDHKKGAKHPFLGSEFEIKGVVQNL